jgi:protein-disulfide isomerase
MVIGAVAVMLVAVAILVGVLFSRGTGSSGGEASVPPSATDEGGFRVGGGKTEGVEPVEVVLYDDFLCADCAETESQLGGYLATQAETGVVDLEYRPVALPGDTAVEQTYAVRAGAAAACVAESDGIDGFLVYRRALYLNAQALTSDGYEDGALADLADDEGLDGARECIESDSYEGWVTANTEAAAAAGVEAVPAVLVAGEPVSAGEDGKLQLDDMLAAVSAARVAAE